MLPTIRGGDIVHVDENFNFENLKIGDIVIFYPEGEDFAPVHRIVQETEGGWITRGDNNKENDPWVLTKENFRGKIVRIDLK